MGHLHILVLQQTTCDADVAVVLRGPGRRRGDQGHPAAWTILHPPGPVHGHVEGHDQVTVLQAETIERAILYTVEMIEVLRIATIDVLL